PPRRASALSPGVPTPPRSAAWSSPRPRSPSPRTTPTAPLRCGRSASPADGRRFRHICGETGACDASSHPLAPVSAPHPRRRTTMGGSEFGDHHVEPRARGRAFPELDLPAVVTEELGEPGGGPWPLTPGDQGAHQPALGRLVEVRDGLADPVDLVEHPHRGDPGRDL